MTELLRAVLDTLLREDFQGIRSRGSVVDGQLRFDHGGRPAEIPVRPDGFLCDLAVSEPVVTCGGRVYDDLESVLALFRQRVDPVDLDGFDAFAQECQAALDTLRTQQDHRTAVLGPASPASRRPHPVANSHTTPRASADALTSVPFLISLHLLS